MQYAIPTNPQEIFFDKYQHLGIIILNRPQQLNALSLAMINAMHTQLQTWEVDDSIHAVLITAIGERAFCAGGDIVSLYNNHQTGKPNVAHFFAVEYQLNEYIKNYSKPYIAIMHGITMGGGVGVSIHGKYRIATDNLLFAMPETGIGYFPDVGGSYFLSRCDHQFGTYLALTGTRINCYDAYYAKFIDNIIRYQDITRFINMLGEQSSLSTTSIENCIQQFQQPIIASTFAQQQRDINEIFSHHSMEEILQQLSSLHSSWAQETLQVLQSKSPMSLKVTLAMLRKGLTLSFTDCMKMEYGLAEHFVQQHDVYEGIRAAVIKKDFQPRWQPATLPEIDDTMVEAYFRHR